MKIVQANIVKDGSHVSILIEGKTSQIIYTLNIQKIIEAEQK